MQGCLFPKLRSEDTHGQSTQTLSIGRGVADIFWTYVIPLHSTASPHQILARHWTWEPRYPSSECSYLLTNCCDWANTQLWARNGIVKIPLLIRYMAASKRTACDKTVTFRDFLTKTCTTSSIGISSQICNLAIVYFVISNRSYVLEWPNSAKNWSCVYFGN